MAAPISDLELVTACLDGDAQAWDALVDRYKRLVYSVALRSGLDQLDAEDVFQTVFARLVQHLPRMRDARALGAWLITTTRRASWRLLKRRRRELPSQIVTAGETWLADSRSDDQAWLDQALVRDGLELLGDHCRRLLWALYYDPTEPSYGVISDRMQMPLGSIGPTRARCLTRLREILGRMGLTM